MYSVSEAYIEQMMNRGTRRRLAGKVGDVPFTGEDVILDSFSVTGKAAEESNTKIGGVFLGELELTFVPSFLNKVAREEFFGKEVEISIGLWIPDPEDEINGGDWEDVPVGVYTLQAPKISKQGISVSGYDNMKKLDIPSTIDATAGTPYQFLSFIATECGVELGQTEGEVNALANGLELLPLNEENDIETFRDLLYWIAQACGCFACADREGKIVLRRFGTPTGVSFDEMHRDTDVVFSGYTTKWTSVTYIDAEDEQERYYSLDVDNGLNMEMGANPLLQLGTVDAVDRRRRAVLNEIARIQYTPFYMNSARDPAFDLGDAIPFTGGLSGGCTGCVMVYNFTLDNFNFEGYGDDPALASAKDKNDKKASNARKSNNQNQVTYYNFANLSDIYFGNEQEVTLAKISFTPEKETTVKILHEFIMNFELDLSENSYYEIRYYLDGVLLPYRPHESLSGITVTTELPEEETDPIESQISTVQTTITRDFFYVLKNVEPNIRHSWEVKILARGIITGFINTNNAHVCVEGQRLYSEKYFDGFLEFEDELVLVPYGNLSLVSMTESCLVTVVDNIVKSLFDTIGLYDCKAMQVMPATDAINILMEFVGLSAEDDIDFETEDGYRIDVQE